MTLKATKMMSKETKTLLVVMVTWSLEVEILSWVEATLLMMI